MTDIGELATNLREIEEGYWVSCDDRQISYPEDGNSACFQLEENSYWFQHRNNVITAMVDAHPPAGAIFDIGGGNGYVAMGLQRTGYETALVEPGPQGARNAKTRGLNTVIQSTLQDAGFQEAALPAIGLFDVLEHIEDDLGFLKMLHASLKPGGHLYLAVPAGQTLWSIDDTLAGHYRRYSRKTLTHQLQAAGFEICRFSYFFSFLVPPVFLLRTLPSRLGLRKSVPLETSKKEHAAPAGVGRAILERCRAFEMTRIRGGRGLVAGTSCIAVAKKVAGNADLMRCVFGTSSSS
ncbi:MAG: SAM-dependent methyltransferase [Rhodothermales bacterium]|jgi:SAM-dependent methyltransferase